MSRRSFETINYMLRPNKNVERKLIAETLIRLQKTFDIRDYRYVGFGSMWFTDFILMHRVVGICDMVTIESEKSRTKRVEYNKPFACIKVKMEEAATAVGEAVEDKRSVVWLDYDGTLKNALTGDLETAVGAMLNGSLILVSVNANVEQLKGNAVDQVELSPDEYLEAILESTLQAGERQRLTRNDFPELVAEILHSKLKAAALTKPGCEYVPIWTFEYADDATMVTVGGMIANAADRANLSACNLLRLSYLSSVTPYQIALPVVTDKEKRALDKLMPATSTISPKSLEFELRPTEIEAYRKFYLHYPLFNEIAA